MKIDGSVIVITGAGQGLGAALAHVASARNARGIVVADLSKDNVEAVAREVGGCAVTADLATEQGVLAVVQAARAAFGTVDIWISNAGIGVPSDPFSGDETFDLVWRLHVMSHVWTARALLPEMLKRGSGHLAAVASSNALTSNPISMAYAVTKHAQLAATEWLAMTYGRQGIGSTCFCPKGMLTPLLVGGAKTNAYAATALVGAVTPTEAATMMLDGIEQERGITLTYPPVMDEALLRLTDHAAYINLLQDLHELVPQIGCPPQ